MRTAQYSFAAVGLWLLMAAATKADTLTAPSDDQCQRYYDLQRAPGTAAPAPSPEPIRRFEVKYPQRRNPDYPCDPKITNDVLLCIAAAHQSLIKETKDPIEKATNDALANQRAIDLLKPIYEVSGCPVYVCSLAQYYLFRQGDVDIKQPDRREELAKVEAVSIKLGERCLALPESSVDPHLRSEVMHLPRQALGTRAKRFKAAGISLMAVGVPGVLASAVLIGLDHQPIIGGGNDCLFGGVPVPCAYETKTGGIIGLGVSLGVTAAGAVLYVLGQRASKAYYLPEKP